MIVHNAFDKNKVSNLFAIVDLVSVTITDLDDRCIITKSCMIRKLHLE